MSVFGVFLVHIFPYSVRMRENTGQKNSEYGHFLRSECFYLWQISIKSGKTREQHFMIMKKKKKKKKKTKKKKIINLILGKIRKITHWSVNKKTVLYRNFKQNILARISRNFVKKNFWEVAGNRISSSNSEKDYWNLGHSLINEVSEEFENQKNNR